MRKYFSKQQFFTSAAAVFLSVLAMAVVTYGASIIDTASVGSGTSTPGAALGVKGAGIFEDFVWGNAFIGTSTSQASGFGTTSPGSEFAVAGGGLFEGFVHAASFRSTSTDTSWLMGGTLGLGTTTPGAKLAVRGEALFDGRVTASTYTATSTTATSTVKFGLDVATSSLLVDGVSGAVTVGTSTVPNADVATTFAVDPALTISGVGAAASATGTLYIAGGGSSGGQIILKSTDGNRCVSITATNGTTGLDTGGGSTTLTTKIVACPR